MADGIWSVAVWQKRDGKERVDKMKMRAEQKTAVKNSIGRLAFVALSVLLQVIWICVQAMKLNRYSTWISVATSVLTLVVVILLYGRRTNAAFKMPWIILILAFPVLGLGMYMLFGRKEATRLVRERFERIDQSLDGLLMQDEAVRTKLQQTDRMAANEAAYIWNYGKYPIYQNTDVIFYKEASEGIEAQKQALNQAKQFIFMEYHAIEDKQSFGELKEILARKAKEGVEVRLFYDDIGSIGFINTDFIQRMEAEGIQCRVFNRLMPVLNVFMNNRDHRKITVIDGKIGFTGGYNLADEYFNITHPYGYWKDTGVRLEGDAVRSLTVMFLEMWNAIRCTDTDYTPYFPQDGAQPHEEDLAGSIADRGVGAAQSDTNIAADSASGFVQPYADSPLDGEPVGENVYMGVVKAASEYVYFTTPYLIISDEMSRELCLAAKRGVDVRIITPGIPDKKLVYRVTRSYYAQLASAGVRIFEYTPGFLHAKQCVSDDVTATVGTINLDYRSLYFHFENGVFLHRCEAVQKVREDFEDIFPVCREVTEQYAKKQSAAMKFGQCVLRLIAPLL